MLQYGISISAQDAFSMHAQDFLEPAFKKFIEERGRKKEFNNLYAQLLSPVLPSFINEERKSLLSILAEIQKNKKYSDIFAKDFDYASRHFDEMPEIEKMLEGHSKKFYWVQNNYAKVKILDKLHFLNELYALEKAEVDGAKAKKEIDESLENAIMVKAKLIKELKIPKDLLDLIKITEVFAYMQDERKKNVLIANHYQRKFVEEASRRTGVPTVLLEYSVLPELKQIVETGKADLEELSSRRRHCLIIHTRSGYEVFDGAETNEVYEKLFGEKTNADAQTKGSCASEGKATGCAKIVLKTHDLANMQQGDVLIASMTRPEMVSAMKKASAIVTDEGGVTSHAAIVSRELGIPCIVGTKNATKIFKDGDLIEVDAAKGTAKKIG